MQSPQPNFAYHFSLLFLLSLQSNDNDERLQVVKLLAKMFGAKDSELAAQNKPLWQCYLGRWVLVLWIHPPQICDKSKNVIPIFDTLTGVSICTDLAIGIVVYHWWLICITRQRCYSVNFCLVLLICCTSYSLAINSFDLTCHSLTY